MKKEEIAVKLTIKNRQKVLKTLRDAEQEYRATYRMSVLENNKLVYKDLYIYYSADSKLWVTSLDKPKGKTLIKPKQLKELLKNEPPYTSKYWDNPFWQEPHKQGTWTITGSVQNSELIGVKGGIGDKGLEYKPKTLEVGKWYKYQSLLRGKFMFLFTGEFGNGKAIGFDAYGEYSNGLSIYKFKIPEYTEAKIEEVIEAFIYHKKNFADKNRNV